MKVTDPPLSGLGHPLVQPSQSAGHSLVTQAKPNPDSGVVRPGCRQPGAGKGNVAGGPGIVTPTECSGILGHDKRPRTGEGEQGVRNGQGPTDLAGSLMADRIVGVAVQVPDQTEAERGDAPKNCDAHRRAVRRSMGGPLTEVHRGDERYPDRGRQLLERTRWPAGPAISVCDPFRPRLTGTRCVGDVQRAPPQTPLESGFASAGTDHQMPAAQGGPVAPWSGATRALRGPGWVRVSGDSVAQIIDRRFTSVRLTSWVHAANGRQSAKTSNGSAAGCSCPAPDGGIWPVASAHPSCAQFPAPY